MSVGLLMLTGVAVPDVAVVVYVAVDGAITVGVAVCVAVAVPIVGVVGTSAWGLSGLPHVIMPT